MPNAKRVKYEEKVKVLCGKKTYYIDVDDTLIFWPTSYKVPFDDCIEFIDPYDLNKIYYGRPNYRLIKQIKGHKKYNKSSIVVWSKSGWRWAEYTVKLLGLEDYIDVVSSKPDWYIDDKRIDSQKFPWKRIYKPKDIP